MAEYTSGDELKEPRVCRLWLVRHGTTLWNQQQRFCGQSDIALSNQGRVQAQWVARRLRIETLSAIYTSDLQRARETAEIIASEYPQTLPLYSTSAWREVSFGEWEGLTYAEIAARYPDQSEFFSDPLHHTPSGGEPFAQLVQRARAAFYALAQDVASRPAGDSVLVSHGGILRAILCSLLGMPFERQWQLRLDPGTLSALDFVPSSEDVGATVTLALLNSGPQPRRVPFRRMRV